MTVAGPGTEIWSRNLLVSTAVLSIIKMSLIFRDEACRDLYNVRSYFHVMQMAFRRHLIRPCGPPSLLCNGYRVPFPRVKRTGRGVDHPPPSSAEVKERVELYLYSPSGPSWPVLGWPLPVPSLRITVINTSCHTLSLYYADTRLVSWADNPLSWRNVRRFPQPVSGSVSVVHSNSFISAMQIVSRDY